MARACATKRSLSSWTSYKKGLVDSGKSCGVLVVSPLIALMHAYTGMAGVFTQTSSVKPNPFANVTIKIDVIFKLNACANSVHQAFPPRFEGLGTRLRYHTTGCLYSLDWSGLIYRLATLSSVAVLSHKLFTSSPQNGKFLQ